jgi:uncharacterized membrane protein YdjX (TVP38/TMEM64 family)
VGLRNAFNIFGVTISRHRRLLIATAAILTGLLVLGHGLDGVSPPADWREPFVAQVERLPLWAFVTAFLILPALGFPIFVFYLSIGAVVDGLGPALLIAWGCMSGNMALSHLLARQLRRPLRRLAERRGYRIPRIQAADEWRVVVTIRASPLPWLMQSCLLTLGGARFVPYMLYGAPVQALVGLGVVLLGDALFSGAAEWALVGFSLLIGVALALPVIRRRAGRATTASRDASP